MSWRGEKLLLAHLFTHEERWKLRDEYLIHLQERFKRLKLLESEMKSKADYVLSLRHRLSEAFDTEHQTVQE
jgi:hypothetical protein